MTAAPRCWSRATLVARVASLVGGDTSLLHRIEIVESSYGLATGDFDGDGPLDFAVANDAADYVSVFLTR